MKHSQITHSYREFQICTCEEEDTVATIGPGEFRRCLPCLRYNLDHWDELDANVPIKFLDKEVEAELMHRAVECLL